MTSHFIYGPHTLEASATDRGCCGNPRLSSVTGAGRLRTLVPRQGRNEGGYGGTGNGVTPLRIDVGQGEQDKCPLVQAWVRQDRTTGCITDVIIVCDQVKIKDASLVAHVTRATELRLHLM